MRPGARLGCALWRCALWRLFQTRLSHTFVAPFVVIFVEMVRTTTKIDKVCDKVADKHSKPDMPTDKPKTLHYKRSHFATQLPVDYLYSPSHAWMGRQDEDHWRVGLTKFATRM